MAQIQYQVAHFIQRLSLSKQGRANLWQKILFHSSCRLICSQAAPLYVHAVWLCLELKKQLRPNCFICLGSHISLLLAVLRTRRHLERPAERSTAAFLRTAARVVAQPHGQTEHHQWHPADVWIQSCLSCTAATQRDSSWHGPIQ